MSMITLTLNVNLSTAKMGTKVDIYTDKIIGIAAMPTAGTVLICNGGASIPVAESKEQIQTLIKDSTINTLTKE